MYDQKEERNFKTSFLSFKYLDVFCRFSVDLNIKLFSWFSLEDTLIVPVTAAKLDHPFSTDG